MTPSAHCIWVAMVATSLRSLFWRVTWGWSRYGVLDGSRTRASTSTPPTASFLITARPMNPPPPVTTTRKVSCPAPRLPDRQGRVDRLQPALDVVDESARLRAVRGAVVEAEAHVHHRLDADRVLAVWGRNDDGALDDGLHRQDADLRRVDDRLGDERARPAGVVEREGAAAD